MPKELRQRVESSCDWIIWLPDRKYPGSIRNHMPLLIVKYRWSLKASQEAARLLGPEYVNIATDARKVNDGKFGKIPDESTWELGSRPAMVYLCENEVRSSLFSGFLLIKLSLRRLMVLSGMAFQKSWNQRDRTTTPSSSETFRQRSYQDGYL